MKKVNALIKEIKQLENTRKSIQNQVLDKFDELHNLILEEILRRNLFKKMSWRVSHRQHSFVSPGIDSIDADKDDNWKVIEALLEKSNNISHATNVVYLTDYIALDMEGHIVTLLPRIRDTKMQREPKCPVLGDPSDKNHYLKFMNDSLLDFVKKYELKVDFTKAEEVRSRLLVDIGIVEKTIEFGKNLNKLMKH